MSAFGGLQVGDPEGNSYKLIPDFLKYVISNKGKKNYDKTFRKSI
jgi:hypothetical protein